MVQTTLEGARLEIDKLNKSLDLTELKLTSFMGLAHGAVRMLRNVGAGDFQEFVTMVSDAITYLELLRFTWAAVTATTPIGMLMAVPAVATLFGMGINDLNQAINGNMA